MSGMLAVASLKGAPGVSTAALALTAGWPPADGRRPLLIEADPSGGDLLVWRGLDPAVGLVSWTMAARTGQRAAAIEHAQRLAEGVRVVPAPVDGAETRAALGVLARSGALHGRAGGQRPVVLDVGRLTSGAGEGALPPGVDLLAVLVEPTEAELARLTAAATAWTVPAEVGVLLAGESAWPAEQVAAAVGLPVWGALPVDPRGAAAIATGGRGAARGRLGRAAAGLAGDLARLLARHRPARPAPTAPVLAGPAVPALPPAAAGSASTAGLGGWTPDTRLATAVPPRQLPPAAPVPALPAILPPGEGAAPGWIGPSGPPDTVMPAGLVPAGLLLPPADDPAAGPAADDGTGGWRRSG